MTAPWESPSGEPMAGADVRFEYWRAYRRGARLPLLWYVVERLARELAATREEHADRERAKLEYVQRAASYTMEWLLAQDDPGEARRGLERPGSPYWKKWLDDRVWQRIGPFHYPVWRLCGSCGEQAVVEDEFERVSRCLGCGIEAPHEALPF